MLTCCWKNGALIYVSEINENNFLSMKENFRGRFVPNNTEKIYEEFFLAATIKLHSQKLRMGFRGLYTNKEHYSHS